MARINFESRIYKEQGFQDLMIHVGDRQKAKGIVLELFELAQTHWFPKRKPIPKELFESLGFPKVLYGPGGLCVLKSEGVYVRGSEEQFAWLFQKKAAGEASGEARREAAAAKKADQEEPEPEEDRTDVNGCSTPVNVSSTKTNLLTPFSLLSSPSSDSSLSTDSPPKKTKTLGARTFEAYAEAYRATYDGIDPIRDKSANSMFKKLGEKLGEQAPMIAAFYLTHKDATYIKSHHCVELLVRDAQKLRTEMLRGKTITSTSARQQERDGHNKQVVENFIRKKQETRERQV